MTKQEFIKELREKLFDLPKSELEDRLGFYIEMIEDGIEEGKTEEEAVAEIGGAEIVCARIREELSGAECNDEEKFETVAESKELAQSNEIAVLPTAKKKRELSKTASILIFWIGSPIWLALAITLFAAVLVLYVSLWAAVLSVWSVFGACVAAAPALVVLSVINAVSGGSSAVFMLACALVFAGIGIFLFFGSLYATRGSIWLSKTCINYLKKFHKEVA